MIHQLSSTSSPPGSFTDASFSKSPRTVIVAYRLIPDVHAVPNAKLNVENHSIAILQFGVQASACFNLMKGRAKACTPISYYDSSASSVPSESLLNPNFSRRYCNVRNVRPRSFADLVM